MATNNLSAYEKSKLPSAHPYRFGIVVADWNSQVTHNLHKGAVETLIDLGAKDSNIDTIFVPGSIELVYGATKMCKKNIYDAVIVIGCVIRGETAHFDYVCQSVTNGITYLNTHMDTPVVFCVLTDNHIQQSLDRSGGKFGNKGVEAGVVALRMATLKEER
ncbi:6,7-dimethyl-8-ribityllumazine synthase [Apibacter adventoris]|uniref:6,7-dimethyl-8-ribityllumazine synthase n=1 Tax=Apibacter adventoris TaxID=1679466 RepID=A0A2S8AE49_9FLAO|nr:6,7-dimethyl-8-ribityllumazine synthase [Apibacter adventoris]PQL93104.1 6,7-dimethyl-8-ribityllumazine synthase [Apibacter adventoris]